MTQAISGIDCWSEFGDWTISPLSEASSDSRPGLTFVLLSFEGPDSYSYAGGVASRVSGLARELCRLGFETHLFFVGDPDLPGHEADPTGRLQLHRWCQWISAYHPGGVYDGEEGKLLDWQDSLPGWIEREILGPRIEAGGSVVVLAEEWQTAETIVRLGRLTEAKGWGDRVHLFWNANNTFSFDRIDWTALDAVATVTTVSRYMKHQMWAYGVNPRVVPNGIDDAWLAPAPSAALGELKTLLSDRTTIVKVARFDPNKRWLSAIDAVASLKQRGSRPLLFIRGGKELHGLEVIERAKSRGLDVQDCGWSPAGMTGAVGLRAQLGADVLVFNRHLQLHELKVLYGASDAVLANSGVEPFGLVGLEAMASGGLVFVGSTGEDYSLHGFDSISLQTADPDEIAYHVMTYKRTPLAAERIREAAMKTAMRFTWPKVLSRSLLPLLGQFSIRLREQPAEAGGRLVTLGEPQELTLAAG